MKMHIEVFNEYNISEYEVDITVNNIHEQNLFIQELDDLAEKYHPRSYQVIE